MKRTLIGLIIGIIIGLILAQVASPPYEVSSSQMGQGSIKLNRWTGRSWVLMYGSSAASPESAYHWEEIGK